MTGRAYYNEIDSFAIGVLKRRIADGSLPLGDVDERDVRTIQAADLTGYAQVHLFAGIGGFALAARLAGWPDARPLWTGGYPCQPFSLAGPRQGTSDDRYLWPECARLLGAIEQRPAWCLFENVDGHRDLGLDRTLFDLEALGYAGRPFWIPACSVGAPHDRMRVWIVGRALADSGDGQLPQPRRRSQGRDGSRSTRAAHDGWNNAVWIGCADEKLRRTEPNLGLLAHGIPDRVARLRAIGNAIVPQVAARILEAILRSEGEP